MILLPRLERSEVDLVAAHLASSKSDPRETQGRVAELGLRPHWNQSGGIPASDDDRAALAAALRDLARGHGYPEFPDTTRQQSFDREACRILLESSLLMNANGDTRRAVCWSGLTALDVPDLAVWRHASEKKSASASRLYGGNRNFLRRLWLRVATLLLDRSDEIDQWALIDELSEDAFVQIIERPSIASNKRLSCTIGREWQHFKRKGFDMENPMRLATRRIRAVAQIRMLEVLDEQSLEKLVSEAFRYAFRQIRTVGHR